MSGRWRGPNTVKYRSDTVCTPEFSAYNPQRCSAASLVTPYGLNGFGRSVSTVG